MREKKKTDEDLDEAEDENENKTDGNEKAKQATIANNSKNAMNAVPSSPPPTRSNVAEPSAGPSRPNDLQNRIPLPSLHPLMLLLPYPTRRHHSPVQSPYRLDAAPVSCSALAVCLDIPMAIINPNILFKRS